MESFTEQVQIGLVAWQRVCPAARARRRPGYYRLLAVPRIHLHANAEGTISGFEVSDSNFARLALRRPRQEQLLISSVRGLRGPSLSQIEHNCFSQPILCAHPVAIPKKLGESQAAFQNCGSIPERAFYRLP